MKVFPCFDNYSRAFIFCHWMHFRGESTYFQGIVSPTHTKKSKVKAGCRRACIEVFLEQIVKFFLAPLQTIWNHSKHHIVCEDVFLQLLWKMLISPITQFWVLHLSVISGLPNSLRFCLIFGWLIIIGHDRYLNISHKHWSRCYSILGYFLAFSRFFPRPFSFLP